MDENVGSAEEGREGRGEEEENLARLPLLSPPAVEENLFPNSRFLIFVRANFFGFQSLLLLRLPSLCSRSKRCCSFPFLNSLLLRRRWWCFCVNPFEVKKNNNIKKVSFCFLPLPPFFPSPPPLPLLLLLLSRKRRSKTYGPCFVFHAVIGMLTNQWGSQIQLASPIRKKEFFFTLFLFFFFSYLSDLHYFRSLFLLPLLLSSFFHHRESKQAKKGIKTKNQKPGAMMIKRQITQRTRVSDSVRPHRRR